MQIGFQTMTTTTAKATKTTKKIDIIIDYIIRFERVMRETEKILKEEKKRRGLSTQHFLFSLSILNIRRRFFSPLLSSLMKIISNLIKTIKSNLIYKLQLNFFL